MGTMAAFRRSLLATLIVSMSLLGACTPAQIESLPVPEASPSGLSEEAWAHALAAHEQATILGYTTKSIIAVIDYSRPSTERRLWVVDINTGEILLNEYVAHGVRSGGIYPTMFSNRYGSKQSSLGTFITEDSYYGVRGLALRLKGLEPGINDRARDRGIVIHGTPNVSEQRALYGSQGRTEGCPAVSREVAKRLVPMLEDGLVVFAWYPDHNLLARSDFLDKSLSWTRDTDGPQFVKWVPAVTIGPTRNPSISQRDDR
jgi:hypothetical protein